MTTTKQIKASIDKVFEGTPLSHKSIRQLLNMGFLGLTEKFMNDEAKTLRQKETWQQALDELGLYRRAEILNLQYAIDHCKKNTELKRWPERYIFDKRNYQASLFTLGYVGDTEFVLQGHEVVRANFSNSIYEGGNRPGRYECALWQWEQMKKSYQYAVQQKKAYFL